MLGFGAGVPLLVFFMLSIGTARALWLQLERLMHQLQAANFQAIDFNNFNEFL